MKKSNYLTMVVAYYLSKYNDSAYIALNHGTKSKTHEAIGNALGVNKNTVKNMRDEFDPLHENKRVGWHQRELRPSRKRVVELYQSLQEEELRDVVLELLENAGTFSYGNSTDLINESDETNSDPVFIVRGITGKKAEEIFIELFEANSIPLRGDIIDKRDYGCGYDFEIIGASRAYIEIKGLDGDSGGISFTSKEWDVAQKEGENYFLVIVKNVSTTPSVEIIQNPAKVLKPKKYIFTTVQIRWNLAIA
jgi:hypothetical protein